MSHFSFWCDSLKKYSMDWLCPTTRLWCLISLSVISAQWGCLWTPLWLSFLLTQTVRKQTCIAESYLCVFQAPPESQSLFRREMSGTAGLSLACGWNYSGMEMKPRPKKQHLMAMGWGSACSWSCSLTSWGGTALIEGMVLPILTFLQLLQWIFWWLDFKASQN